MRKFLVIIFLLLGCIFNAQAQTPKKMVVHMKDGSIQRFTYSQVDSITFDSSIHLIVSAAVKQLNFSSATVNVSFEGDLEDVNEYGVTYGISEEALDAKNSKTGKPQKENSFTLSDLKDVTTYYYQAYATCGDSLITSAVYSFKTKSKYEYVDLGLPSGVKWAAWNIGASSVTDYGKYYQWSDGDGDGVITTGAAPTNIQGTVYDTATQQWGENWQMPTEAQIQELTEKCEWEGIDNYQNSGVNGYLVTGPNGNTIFIPSAGYIPTDKTSVEHLGSVSMYWSSEASAAKAGCYFQFAAFSHSSRYTSATVKMPIRAIYVEKGSTPSDPGNPPVVDPMGKAPEGTEAVDLGLSVKWSSFNLGATSVAGVGDFYMWGDTQSKSSFSQSDYPHLNADGSLVDIGIEISNTEYDAAKAQWGGSWRMPTRADWSELINGCNWEWKTVNNKKGFKVTSKTNGNSIFLPVTGEMSETGLVFKSEGYYWESCPEPTTSLRQEWALRMVFSEPTATDSGITGLKTYKYHGCIIRPVMDK